MLSLVSLDMVNVIIILIIQQTECRRSGQHQFMRSMIPTLRSSFPKAAAAMCFHVHQSPANINVEGSLTRAT
jgi:hypothetical protein